MLRRIGVERIQKKRLYRRAIAALLSLIHIAAVLYITLLDRIPGERRFMLSPFWEIRNVIHDSAFWMKQITGNLLLLLPTGFLLPAICRYQTIRWYHVAAAAFCFSVLIEITQYFTGRGLMELDDVFHNTAGSLIGYMLYCAVQARSWKK